MSLTPDRKLLTAPVRSHLPPPKTLPSIDVPRQAGPSYLQRISWLFGVMVR